MNSNHSWTVAKAVKVIFALVAFPALLLAVASCTSVGIVKLSHKPDVVLIDGNGNDMEPVYKFSSHNLAAAKSVRVDGRIYQVLDNEHADID